MNKIIERKIRDVRVKEIMTKDTIHIDKNDSIANLMKMFEKYDFNSFPVVVNGRIVGIITKLDLLKAFSLGLELRRIAYLNMIYAERVGDIMRKAVISLDPDDTVKRAIEYMIEFNLRSLPVVDEGKLVGMISRKDVLGCLEIIYEQD